MRVRVIIPPDPIVTPADIAGDHTADDATVAAMIQAVTEEIDGPGGWLGRSLGEQTIELSLTCWPACLQLPYGPIIEIEGISYFDADDAEQAVDDGSWSVENGYLWFASNWSSPVLYDGRPYPARITYRAGYDGEDVADGGTGPVPERARQAIILSVQQMKSIGAENLFLKSIEVPDVETLQFTLSDQATKIVQSACDRLLSTLRVYV